MNYYNALVEVYTSKPTTAAEAEAKFLCATSVLVAAKSYDDVGAAAIAEVESGAEAWQFYYVCPYATAAEFHPTRQDCPFFIPDDLPF